MATISSHVLNALDGTHASGVNITLSRLAMGQLPTLVLEGQTDTGGRFKQNIDEELWPLVDGIVEQITETEWINWSDVIRRDWVQKWMETIMYTPS